MVLPFVSALDMFWTWFAGWFYRKWGNLYVLDNRQVPAWPFCDVQSMCTLTKGGAAVVKCYLYGPPTCSSCITVYLSYICHHAPLSFFLTCIWDNCVSPSKTAGDCSSHFSCPSSFLCCGLVTTCFHIATFPLFVPPARIPGVLW